MTYTVSSGVPLVKPKMPLRGSKYPFATMAVDDFFFAPDKQNATFATYVSVCGRQLGFKFRTRTCRARLIKKRKVWELVEPEDKGWDEATPGVGVWRVA